ncbi:MAG TPA: fatty acid--CoA ligase, partial [Gallionella sp.]|nr:fatty acid--CoA ligase [Gallionella sp.]
VVVRAPWLTAGYLHDAEASAALWDGGYLHTGDIGVRDATGSLNITDRLKDVIKCSGEWLSSLELESLLSEHPAVGEVAVIGVPDDKWGERPRALVVLKAGCDKDANALCEPVKRQVDVGHLSRYARLLQIDFVESLPRTSVGKLDKKTMRKRVKS